MSREDDDWERVFNMMNDAFVIRNKHPSVTDTILTTEIESDVSHVRYCLNAATNPFYGGGDEKLDDLAESVNAWDESFINGMMLGVAMALDTDKKVRGLGRDTPTHIELSKVYHSLKQVILERRIGGGLDVGRK